jgi:hypothetical protein
MKDDKEILNFLAIVLKIEKHNLAERGTYEINAIRHNFSNYGGHDDLCHASDTLW